MKKLILAAVLLASATGAMAQVGVSINIGQPNFYGHIDLGNVRERPPVVYEQPIIVERGPRYVAEPMYLRVPPGHMKKWNKHCRSYNACGRQVYFVRDEWYSNTYAPRYRQSHGGHDRRDDRRGDYRDDRRDDRRSGNVMERAYVNVAQERDRDHDRNERNDRDDDRGHGKHKDKGHGKHRD